MQNNKNEDRGKGQRTPSGLPASIKKASSATNIVDDLSSMFGGNFLVGHFMEVPLIITLMVRLYFSP